MRLRKGDLAVICVALLAFCALVAVIVGLLTGCSIGSYEVYRIARRIREALGVGK